MGCRGRRDKVARLSENKARPRSNAEHRQNPLRQQQRDRYADDHCDENNDEQAGRFQFSSDEPKVNP